MNKDTIQQVYLYLKDFINQKGEHPEYIDYYQMFGLDKSNSIQEIKNSLKDKKIRKLFHPDQASYLDEELRDVYNQSILEVTEMNNVFSSERSKMDYDKMLTSKKKKNNMQQDSSTFHNQNSKLYSEEAIVLDNAIRNTIDKYGFYQGYMALEKVLRNDFSCITNDNNFRDMLKSIGVDSIREIVMSKRVDIMETNSNNIAMDYYSTIIEGKYYESRRDAFYNVCKETALKYDVKQGINQLSAALDKYMTEGSTNGFTNNNGARNAFDKSGIRQADAWILMCSKMHREAYRDNDYLFSNYSKKSATSQINEFSDSVKASVRSYSTFK